MSRDGGRNDKFFDIPNTKFFFNDAKDQNNELGNNAGSYTPNGELSTEDSLQDTQNLLRNKFFYLYCISSNANHALTIQKIQKKNVEKYLQ